MTPHEQDSDVLALQIGRPLRATSMVLRRCNLGLPIVAEVPPILDTGEPFPTRYWLSCPLAHRRIARLEAEGGVRTAQAKLEIDPALAAQLASAHARYERERDESLSPGVHPRPSGGVGGSSGGVKCLHAHYADHAVGNTNPIGLDVARTIGEPGCTVPCVMEIDGRIERNPDWRETDGL
ncbi:MAG: DUF501 domain-containing protein [Myxococcales bacterium]|nr:DUF501 domain-containing protein [Myxococcales bacterium]